MTMNDVKKAVLMKKNGLKFHVYEDFDGEATVYYFPEENDVFTDSFSDSERPADIAYGDVIPSELLLFSGKVSNCERWFSDGDCDGKELAKAALKRVHDEDGWALSFYMNGCRLDGSATDIDAEYKEDGLTLY